MRKFKLIRGHDIYNTALASKFAEAAYDEEEMGNLCERMGFECLPVKDKNHSMYLCAGDKVVVAAYTGTNDPGDLLTDIDYPQTEGVHSGVHKAGMALNFDESFIGDRLLILTGHSLGGGLSGNKALTCKHAFARNYTFGGMRYAAPGIFAPKILTTRVVLDIDIVPHLPLSVMPVHDDKAFSLAYYQHYSETDVFLNKDGTFSYSRTLWDSLKDVLVAGVEDLIDLDITPALLEDHSSTEYRKAMCLAAFGTEDI